MQDEVVRVYLGAHVAFFLTSLFLLTDQCSGAPTLLRNEEFSWLGMQYISEKIMVCRHSSSLWRILPETLGLAVSVIMIQHYATFLELAPSGEHTNSNIVFMALVTSATAGWGLLISFDHRQANVDDNLVNDKHFASVALFLTSFFAVHVLVSQRYAASRALFPEHAAMRRCSYFAADALYVGACVLFCVTAIMDHVYHAILWEYVIFALFCALNTASFVILLRIYAYPEQEGSTALSL